MCCDNWKEKFSQPTVEMNPVSGRSYGIPNGMRERNFLDIVDEFIELAQTKNLTTRQIQYIFKVCADRVLDFTFD